VVTGVVIFRLTSFVQFAVRSKSEIGRSLGNGLPTESEKKRRKIVYYTQDSSNEEHANSYKLVQVARTDEHL
jgi:hypothetical protein